MVLLWVKPLRYFFSIEESEVPFNKVSNVVFLKKNAG
jgi:hypothetical protein